MTVAYLVQRIPNPASFRYLHRSHLMLDQISGAEINGMQACYNCSIKHRICTLLDVVSVSVSGDDEVM